MAQQSKKYKKAHEALDSNKLYSVQEGVAKVASLAYARFDESADAAVVLGINPARGEEAVRGAVTLPHGSGRTIKILVFAKGQYADEAEKAGADYVGAEDLIARIESGWLDFNYALATPDLMGMVGKVARLLGPRGLLPNKKNGTVTFDVASTIKELKQGRLFFKNDKAGIVHFSFGKLSQGPAHLADNLTAFIKALSANKPSSSKGKFIRKVTISSTMGPGIAVNADEV
jgi:large subunit ribosomal protein L1